MLWTISHHTIEFMRQLLMLDLKPADLPATNLLSESRKEVFLWLDGCFAISFLITSGHFLTNLVQIFLWRSRKASKSKGIQLQQRAAWNISSLDWRVQVSEIYDNDEQTKITWLWATRTLLIAWSTRGKSLERMKIHDDAMLFEIASNNLRYYHIFRGRKKLASLQFRACQSQTWSSEWYINQSWMPWHEYHHRFQLKRQNGYQDHLLRQSWQWPRK